MSSRLQKILYVEDEKDIQRIAEAALVTVGGFQLKICSSGSEALREIASYQPDLILLDVMMPDMDGVATLENIRKMPESMNIPVVFITAKAQAHEIQKFKQLGVIDVISKPFDPMTLPDDLRKIWNRTQKAS